MDNVKYRLDRSDLTHEQEGALQEFVDSRRYSSFMPFGSNDRCLEVVAPWNFEVLWKLYSFSHQLKVGVNGGLFSIDDVISENFRKRVNEGSKEGEYGRQSR